MADAVASPTGGQKTVTASGTAEELVAASQRATWLYVRALATNTNNVYFGDSSVEVGVSEQLVLDAGESVTIDPKEFGRVVIDVHEFFIDVDTNGEGVSFLYLS
jgi:hypothetical protein